MGNEENMYGTSNPLQQILNWNWWPLAVRSWLSSLSASTSTSPICKQWRRIPRAFDKPGFLSVPSRRISLECWGHTSCYWWVTLGFCFFFCQIILFFQGTNFDVRYPYMIFMVCFFIGTLAMMFLPETLHQKLPETLKEAEKFGKSQPFWYFPKPTHNTTEESSHFAKGDKNGHKDSEILEKLNQPQFSP